MSGAVRARERCGCGASIELDGPPDMVLSVVEIWRSSHRHGTPSATTLTASSWQERYVGRRCTVCDIPLDDPDTLTTVEGLPIHKACRACSICGETKPYPMGWTGRTIGVGQDRLVHARCARRALNDEDAGDDTDDRAVNRIGNRLPDERVPRSTESTMSCRFVMPLPDGSYSDDGFGELCGATVVLPSIHCASCGKHWVPGPRTRYPSCPFCHEAATDAALDAVSEHWRPHGELVVCGFSSSGDLPCSQTWRDERRYHCENCGGHLRSRMNPDRATLRCGGCKESITTAAIAHYRATSGDVVAQGAT